MVFRHNSIGVEPSGGKFQPLPEGEYRFVIEDAVEKVSKEKRLPMVEVLLSVIEDNKYQGKTLKHFVVFIPAGQKGDGMCVHFRRCIGVPYGGEDDVDASTWKGRKLRATLKTEERDYNGKHYVGNKVATVMPYGEDFPPVDDGSDVPF